MNNAAASAVRREFRTSLRLETACEFSAVRTATVAVREWLAEKGLPEADLGGWELALVEAANNAVKYADEKARQMPVIIEVSCGEREVEARITDHTAGFEWPAEVDLPDMESESGRGLFLMKSLTDHLAYLRHPGENVMVLRRACAIPVEKISPDIGHLQNRLADAETALTDMTAELASSYESLRRAFSLQLGTGRTCGFERFFATAVERFDADRRGGLRGAAAGFTGREKTGAAAWPAGG